MVIGRTGIHAIRPRSQLRIRDQLILGKASQIYSIERRLSRSDTIAAVADKAAGWSHAQVRIGHRSRGRYTGAADQRVRNGNEVSVDEILVEHRAVPQSRSAADSLADDAVAEIQTGEHLSQQWGITAAA